MKKGRITVFVMALAHGGGNFYDGWMQPPKYGFRPVRFYLEALDQDAEASSQ